MRAAFQNTTFFQPLLQARFRRLWLANLLSNIGGWAQAFAVAWQVSVLSESALMTSLVQTATWAPMLLFSLPAGLLGDFMHKPRLLFHCSALMGLTAAAMALLTAVGEPSAIQLLLLTLLMGVGVALKQPAWQASMPELVEKEHLASVVSLNNISNNVAALAGPSLGGPLLQQFGPTPLYAFNAFSFCGLLWFYKEWIAQEETWSPVQRLQMRAMIAGFAASWQAVRYRKLLLYSLLIFCSSIAFPALLPSLVRNANAKASDLGVLMGALGAGAVLASAVLPQLRQHLPQRRLLAGALAAYGAMMGLIGLNEFQLSRVLLVLVGGMAWSAIVTTLNRTAIAAFPAALRARTLSTYIFMFAAGQTLGSLLWGKLANGFGVIPILLCAAGAMVACAVSMSFTENFLDTE
jgi:MFS family permease